MSDYELFIGNKNYSSWSLRPWIALKHKDIPFRETLVPFDFENGNPEFAAFSPTGKVPVLKDGNLTIWDSLAILEYLADCFPDKGLWPQDKAQRAWARSISAEMHSGFSALRSECSMNMQRPAAPKPVSEAVKNDVTRIVTIWKECLEASGGPFLFGDFTIADAMYAPVVSRLETYQLSSDPVVRKYSEAMTATPAWKIWEEAALRETWVVDTE